MRTGTGFQMDATVCHGLAAVTVTAAGPGPAPAAAVENAAGSLRLPLLGGGSRWSRPRVSHGAGPPAGATTALPRPRRQLQAEAGPPGWPTRMGGGSRPGNSHCTTRSCTANAAVIYKLILYNKEYNM